MLAAKHLDPVLGVDVHIIQPPGPVPPVPIPHPHIGIVFDPCDYVPILGATVQIGGIPRAVAGTAGKCVPPHIPIGGMFVKPPSNENEIFMGSSTVVFEDEPASFMALPVLSCQCVGMVAPLRPKKKSKTMSLVLPTSVVLPIPAGPPVMIGGPPTISMMALGMRAGMAALGKAFKKLRKLQKASKRMKRLSKRIHKAADKVLDKVGVKKGSRLRNRIHRGICSVTGHPVDVATGKMFTEAVDLELPGPLPFKLERVWYSTSTYQGPLGHGWHHSYDMSVVATDEVVLARLADGRYASFAPPEEGRPSWNAQERMKLDRSRGGYVLTEEATGLRYHFGAAADGQVEKALEGEGHEALLSRVEDRNGNRIRLLRRDARLIKIIDSGGRELLVGLDDAGRIGSISGPDPERPGRHRVLVSYRYDEAGDLVEVRDALENPFRYQYRNHLLCRETDRNGLSFHFEYDGNDENASCIRTWGDAGIFARTLTYDPANQRTTVVDSRGGSTLYEWNALGLVTREVDPLGNEKQMEYDDDGNRIAETNACGEKTTYAYDERGCLTSDSDPLGGKTEYHYDEHGNLVVLTDALGQEWRREYDDRCNVIGIVDPQGNRWRFFLDPRGLPIREIDPAGRTLTLEWSKRGDLERWIDRAGAEASLEYDALGRVVRRLDRAGNETRLIWDRAGRLTEVEASGRRYRYHQDAGGNVIMITDPLGRTRRCQYGPMGIVTKVEEPTGAARSYRYDKELKVTAVMDARQKQWRFERDSVGRVTAEISFDGRRLTYGYDAADRIVSSTNARGMRTTYERDAAGNLTRRAYHDGTEEIFAYDLLGRTTRAVGPGAQLEWVYDAWSRVLSETLNGETTVSEYDALGNRLIRQSPLGRRLEVSYDAEDRITSIRDAQGPLMELAYDPLGRTIRRTYPGEVSGHREYLATGELSSSRLTRGDRTLPGRAYEYDDAGQMTAIHHDRFGTSRFEHDPEGRLVAAIYPDLSVERYLYDAAGNVPGIPEGPPPDDTLRFDTRVDGWRLAYDGDGNLVEKRRDDASFCYEYDAAGRLASVRTGIDCGPSGHAPVECVVEFAYDPLGRRVLKRVTEAGKETRRVRFLWDGDVLLGEREERLSPEGEREDHEREYVFRPDSFEPLAQLGAGGDCLIEGDPLGTPQAALDRDGDLRWEAGYSGFGQIRQELGEPGMVPFRFPGQYHDQETGLYYNRFRYYDPELKRYTRPDPIELEGGFKSWNYVPSPLGWIDPYGLSCKIHSVEEILPNRPPVISKELTEAEAISLVRAGGDILVSGGTRRARRKLAKRISESAGSGSTMHHARTPSAGHGTLSHQHGIDAGGGKMPGHVFVDDPGRSQSPFH